MMTLSINYIMKIRHEAHHDEKHDENVMRIYRFFLFMKLDI
jgi:hypothetical protein